MHQFRPLLAHFAQHPANGLADEEFFFGDHGGGEFGEESKVALTCPQGHQQRQQGSPVDPEVFVLRPALQHSLRGRVPLHQGSGHLGRQTIDMVPGVAAA